MRDVVYVAMTLGFFALAGFFVRGCARIVGPDDPGLDRDDPAEADQQPTDVSGSVTS